MLYVLKMLRYAALFSIIIATYTSILFAQQHGVDPAHRYHRLICLVHLTGGGTAADPVRPEYVPNATDTPSRSGILAWSAQMSDDGKMAIVEYVAADRAAFASILADKRPEVLVFEIGKNDRNTIETALKVFKKGFSLDSLRLPVE